MPKNGRIVFLVQKGSLFPRTFVVVYGDPGCGKSFIMSHMTGGKKMSQLAHVLLPHYISNAMSTCWAVDANLCVVAFAIVDRAVSS